MLRSDRMASVEQLQERLGRIAPLFRLDERRAELARLEAEAQAPDLWTDSQQAAQTLSQLSAAKTFLKQWDDLQELLGVGGLSEPELNELEAEVQVLERRALLSGEHDEQPALLTIHAGTGRLDAQDWAEMLMRMVIRYVEAGATELPEERTLGIDRRDWKVEILDISRADEAGIKRVEMEVRGTLAFGLLKSEAGVHRLVRLSPFNAKNLRQTSFALVEVIPEIEREKAPVIDERDLRIDVFRAGGHGGQGVNTTDSAVRITHIPTGITVSVQNERSQHQNKATAMTILQSRLARLKELQNAEEIAILRGEVKEGTWGNQIRSYVLQPYQMVKDHRTGWETANVQKVLDGDLKGFIEAYLSQST